MEAENIKQRICKTLSANVDFINWVLDDSDRAEHLFEAFERLSFCSDAESEEKKMLRIMNMQADLFPEWERKCNDRIAGEMTEEFKEDLFYLWMLEWFSRRDVYMKLLEDRRKDIARWGFKGRRASGGFIIGSQPHRPLFSFGRIPLGARPYWELHPCLIQVLLDLCTRFEFTTPDLRRLWDAD